MQYRNFEFKDQNTIFAWWNNEGLKARVGTSDKALEWCKTLLGNKGAYILEDEGKLVGIFLFAELYSSDKGHIARAFCFSPYHDYLFDLENAMLKAAADINKNSKNINIISIQFYRWEPILTERLISDFVEPRPLNEEAPQNTEVEQQEEPKENPEEKKKDKKEKSDGKSKHKRNDQQRELQPAN